MMETRSSKLWMCFSLIAACIAIAATARAGDDTARFYGTWQATFPYNGQMLDRNEMFISRPYSAPLSGFRAAD